MADESGPFVELNDRVSKLYCRSIIAALTFKYIIADMATINRSPDQARKFVDGMKSRLDEFSRIANNDGSKTDEMFKEEMLNYADLIFSGITFDRDTKS